MTEKTARLTIEPAGVEVDGAGRVQRVQVQMMKVRQRWRRL
jgi:hypothetical protein